MNLKFLIALLSFTIVGLSQTPLLTIPNDLRVGNRSVENAIAVVDDENETFSTFLIDENSINAYQYSKNFEPISKFTSHGLPEDYDEIIGKTIKNGQIRLFLKEYYNKKFGAIIFDFERKKSIITEFNFKLDNEIYLQSHSYKNNFYILTVDKRSSILNVYTFEHTGKFGKKTFDFTENHFENRRNKPTTLFHLLAKHNSEKYSPESSVVKIEESNPNSLEITSNLAKVYDRGDKLLLTIDEADSYTYLFEFNVTELTVKLQTIKNLHHKGDEVFNTNNSYLFGDKIFQIGGNSKIMVFTVKDLETKEVLKSIELLQEEEITFKNSPIIQESFSNSSFEQRELANTALFLQIFNGGNSGVSVIPVKDGYQITMGGSENLESGSFGSMTGISGGFGGGIALGSSGSSSVGFNSTYYAFGNYKTNRSKRINCLFNSDFEHIEGEISQNVFDKLKEHTLKIPMAIAENIFKLDDFYVYGRYFSIENTYKFYKFSE